MIFKRALATTHILATSFTTMQALSSNHWKIDSALAQASTNGLLLL